jgi:hypothetical protein
LSRRSRSRLLPIVERSSSFAPRTLRHMGKYERWIAHRRKGYPEDAVRVIVGELPGRPERQPRLPTASGAGQRGEPNIAAPQEIGYFVKLALTAEKRRRRYRQIRVGQGLQRWECAVAELVEPLRRGEVFEPVSPEITDFDVDEGAGRRAEQNLSAVRHGRDPRRTMHVVADVALGGHLCLARVQTHPHPHRPFLEQPLGLSGRRDGLPRRSEGDEERVPLRVDLDSAVTGEHLTQHPPVLDEQLRISLAVLLQQPVDPSMSVNRKVVVPVGSSLMAWFGDYDPRRPTAGRGKWVVVKLTTRWSSPDSNR